MRDLIGQPRAVELLSRQLQSGRLHHAYIFHGPAGVGKMTCALAFAAAWLCHNRTDAEPCGTCPCCTALGPAILHASGLETDDEGALALGYADLHVLTKEAARYHEKREIRERKLTRIPLELLRDNLIEPAYIAPTAGPRKVFIVDEAELLNDAGQNALLKTLEEPPAGTMIILVTSSEERLLPTIRSRCQRIAFVPLSDADVRDHIAAHAQDLSPARIDRLADLADGSFGRARIALDFNLVSWIDTVGHALEQIDQQKPQPELGTVIYEAINDFATAWVDQHAGASKEAANRLGLSLMAALIAGRARRQLAAAAPELAPDDPIDAEARLATMLGTIDAVEHWTGLIQSNVNLSLACDHLVLKIEQAAGV